MGHFHGDARGDTGPEPEVFVRRHEGTVVASVAVGTRVLRTVGYNESEVWRWVRQWALSAAGSK